jgi:hypothetical protein
MIEGVPLTIMRENPRIRLTNDPPVQREDEQQLENEQEDRMDLKRWRGGQTYTFTQPLWSKLGSNLHS